MIAEDKVVEEELLQLSATCATVSIKGVIDTGDTKKDQETSGANEKDNTLETETDFSKDEDQIECAYSEVEKQQDVMSLVEVEADEEKQPKSSREKIKERLDETNINQSSFNRPPVNCPEEKF